MATDCQIYSETQGPARKVRAATTAPQDCRESFVDATDNMNTWVWRQLAPDGDTLLREGVAFIRKMQKKNTE
jgi:hypothetical protein